jgi:hypothetical protein
VAYDRRAMVAQCRCPASGTSTSLHPLTAHQAGLVTAVPILPEDLAEMEETLSVLSDPEALADIRDADPAQTRGDVARGGRPSGNVAGERGATTNWS